jgi:hypothetical protein
MKQQRTATSVNRTATPPRGAPACLVDSLAACCASREGSFRMTLKPAGDDTSDPSVGQASDRLTMPHNAAVCQPSVLSLRSFKSFHSQHRRLRSVSSRTAGFIPIVQGCVLALDSMPHAFPLAPYAFNQPHQSNQSDQ